MKADLIPFFKGILVIYLSSMMISWLVQIFWPPAEIDNKYQHSMVVTSPDGDIDIDAQYFHLDQPDNAQTLVILPDEFMSAEDLIPLAKKLNDHLNVIIPLYATHDPSGSRISHSVEERAALIDELLQKINPENAHLMGYGYGGLIAFNLLAELDSNNQRYKSLILLSSYGPVEMHFMGNRSFNRPLYALLYPVVAVGKYAVPHMGWFHQQPLQFSTIRTIRSMDQRTVRPHAALLELPVLIMHPSEDHYISPLVSEELHRLIPQSFLEMPYASHRDISGKPQLWKDLIIDFTSKASADELPGRADATQERIRLSEKPYDPDEMRSLSGWSLVLILSLFAIFTIFGEDFASISGGLIVASGLLGYWHVVLACFVGILISDVSIYLIGRWIGKPVLDWAPFKWFIKKEDVESAENMFRMKGMQIIFAARFVPGSRFPTYLVAGILKTRMHTFLIYFVMAVALWAPFIVGIASIVGAPMLNFIEVYQDYALLIFIVIVLIIYLLYKLFLPLTTPTGRRRLIVKWERFKERQF